MASVDEQSVVGTVVKGSDAHADKNTPWAEVEKRPKDRNGDSDPRPGRISGVKNWFLDSLAFYWPSLNTEMLENIFDGVEDGVDGLRYQLGRLFRG